MCYVLSFAHVRPLKTRILGSVLEEELYAPQAKRAEESDLLLEDEQYEAEPEPASRFTMVTAHALDTGWAIERVVDDHISDWFVNSSNLS